MRISEPLLLVYILVALSIFTACSDEKVIATIGEHSILQSDFVERYENYLIQTGINDNILSRKEVLNSMISEILLQHYDDNSAINNNIDYIKEVEWTKDQVILAYLKDREVYSKINVSEKEIREVFLRSNQKIAARHLFTSNEEEANNLRELLNIGVDFNTLAKQVFTDSTLKNNGGYLGYFSWGDMEPEFEDKAFSMKVGEISNPIKTKHGYSIIKLEDKVTHPLLTENEFQSKKDKLAQVLRIRKKMPSEKRFISETVQLDKINFSEDKIEALWQQIELRVNGNKELKSQIKDEGTAAEYNGIKYSVSDLQSRINMIPQYHFAKITSKEKLKVVIKGIILKDNLLKMADSKDYTSNKHVEEKKKSMLTNVFMKFKISEIIEKSSIDDSTIYDFYKSNPDFFSTHDRVNVQEILVEDLQLAKSIINQLKSGIVFGDLASEYSIRKATAENDGKLGLNPVKNFGRLQKLFSSSRLNEVIGPIEIDNIYGIFKVIERVGSEPVEFDEAKDVATMAVKFKMKNDILKNYIADLKEKNDVSIDLKNLGSAKIFQFN